MTENRLKKEKIRLKRRIFKMDTLFFKTSIAFYSLPKPGTKNIPRSKHEKQNIKKNL